MQIIKGAKRRPRRILMYGPHGIGKSTWASKAPAPIFLNTEDGLDDIGADRTPLLTDLAAFNGAVSDLIQQPHDYRTVVIDTVDWLERLIHRDVEREEGVKSIDYIGYGKGPKFALAHWEFAVKSLESLRQARNVAVIMLGHARTVRVDDPENTYSRWEPDLSPLASALVQEWADEVLFADYKISVITKEGEFNRKKNIAVDGGQRVLYTCRRPTHLAKRRIEMPDEITLDFATYANYLKTARAGQNGEDIKGVVTDGSSKQKPQKEKEPVNA